MIVRVLSPDLKEMMVELPLRSFSKGNKLKKHKYQIDNSCVKASFSEIRTSLFCVTDTNVLCHDSIKLYLQSERYDNISFCALMKGSVASLYGPFGYQEFWSEGNANILLFEGLNSICFSGNKSFRMCEIMLSEKYMEEFSGQYPELLKCISGKYLTNRQFKVFKENKAFCPKIAMAFNEIFHSFVDGNSEIMYIDAKIREILSLFLCKNKQKDDIRCFCCSCYSTKDHDLFTQVKEIIEKEYVNPPSLRILALMVGTNECKLKNGFKSLFGITVFGYLFEYRMERACHLLLDSEMSIQEISHSIGYEHHSHFSTAFKRKFGISPMEYRMTYCLTGS